MEEFAQGTIQLYYGTQADYILSGAAWWPSFSYWMIPGTQED
jgi:hypothetical protein